MNNEFKKLVNYLPYGLMAKLSQRGNKCTPKDIMKVEGMVLEEKDITFWLEDKTGYMTNRFEIKPILRPLSNFGDSDDTRKVHEFIGLGKWCESYDYYFNAWFDDLANVNKLVLQAPQEIFNYFLTNHFDVFGLIQQGFAISIHDVVQAEA